MTPTSEGTSSREEPDIVQNNLVTANNPNNFDLDNPMMRWFSVQLESLAKTSEIKSITNQMDRFEAKLDEVKVVKEKVESLELNMASKSFVQSEFKD